MIFEQRFIRKMALLPTTLSLSICMTGHAQAPPAKAPAATEFHFPTPAERAAIMAASAKERDRELQLLGITAMQKTRNGV